MLTPGANEIACELEVLQPGEFGSQLHLFIDDQGTREIVFTVQGHINAAKAHEKSDP